MCHKLSSVHFALYTTQLCLKLLFLHLHFPFHLDFDLSVWASVTLLVCSRQTTHYLYVPSHCLRLRRLHY